MVLRSVCLLGTQKMGLFGFFGVAEVSSSLACVGIFPPPYYLNNIENMCQLSKAFHQVTLLWVVVMATD